MQNKVLSLILLAGATLPAYADFKITSRYTAEGQTTETTTYAKGERLRYQYAGGLVLLRDCAQKTILQIDDQNKTFAALPEQPGAGTVSKITLGAADEQKAIFNFNAHHVKSTSASDGGARIETDGWYIDSKDLPSCAAPGSYPMSYTVTTYKDGKTSTVTMEVTGLSTASLEDALFQTPAGYTDADKPAAAQKKPGTVRVAVALLQNRAARPVGPAVQDHLVAQMREAGIDVMPLAVSNPEAVTKRAQDAQCDYVLFTEVTSVEKPAGGKVGGLLHKAPGIGKAVAGDAMEANVTYRLLPVAGGAPVLASTVTAKTGSSFNWKAAVTIAASVTPMMMMTRMMTGGAFNPAMMNSLASGHGYGASVAGMDPMMNTLSLCLRSTSFGADSQPSGATSAATDNAVAAALEQEAKAIVSQLKK